MGQDKLRAGLVEIKCRTFKQSSVKFMDYILWVVLFKSFGFAWFGLYCVKEEHTSAHVKSYLAESSDQSTMH